MKKSIKITVEIVEIRHTDNFFAIYILCPQNNINLLGWQKRSL